MVKEDGKWDEAEIKNFIWKHLCKSENNRFDFAPLLFDVHRDAPTEPKFTEIVHGMKQRGYITDNRPNYGHFWVELEGSGRKKCEEKL